MIMIRWPQSRADVKRPQAKGKNVQLTEYADAGHNFDNRAAEDASQA